MLGLEWMELDAPSWPFLGLHSLSSRGLSRGLPSNPPLASPPHPPFASPQVGAPSQPAGYPMNNVALARAVQAKVFGKTAPSDDHRLFWRDTTETDGKMQIVNAQLEDALRHKHFFSEKEFDEFRVLDWQASSSPPIALWVHSGCLLDCLRTACRSPSDLPSMSTIGRLRASSRSTTRTTNQTSACSPRQSVASMLQTSSPSA